MAYRGMGLTPLHGSSPFSLRREIDRLFDDAFGGQGQAMLIPPVDVNESEREIAIEFELPGIKPENVDVNVENGVLTVSGEKREERKEGEEGRQHVVERRYGRFMRSIQLPHGVDEDQIDASFDNGVLSIRVPKAALPQPKKIQIGSGSRPAVSGGAQERGGRGGSRGESRGTRDESAERMVAGGKQGESRGENESTRERGRSSRRS